MHEASKYQKKYIIIGSQANENEHLRKNRKNKRIGYCSFCHYSIWLFQKQQLFFAWQKFQMKMIILIHHILIKQKLQKEKTIKMHLAV